MLRIWNLLNLELIVIIKSGNNNCRRKLSTVDLLMKVKVACFIKT
jgi:hypothetical protein